MESSQEGPEKVLGQAMGKVLVKVPEAFVAGMRFNQVLEGSGEGVNTWLHKALQQDFKK